MNSKNIAQRICAALTILYAASANAGKPCVPHWDTNIGAPGLNGEVNALVFDDNGNLIAGGLFRQIGALSTNFIASWDGAQWMPLGTGFNAGVNSLAMFNGDLYAGGSFSVASVISAARMARWDGVQWNPVGGGFNNNVLAMTTSSIGGTPSLYAGGLFSNAGGALIKRIARWDGAAWSSLGTGITTPGEASAVHAIAEFDLGAGPRLAVGGQFTVAGGQFASNIAVWDGATWSPMGSGMDGAVRSLAVFDDGSGPALYAGGSFDSAGGIAAKRVARWDGTTWSAVGGAGSWGLGSSAHALEVYNDGAEAVLVAGGDILLADGASVQRLASWDGVQWSPALGGADLRVLTMVVDHSAPEERLLAGGAFSQTGGVPSGSVGMRVGCFSNGLSADLNGDGTVDTADLGTLIGSFGTADPVADINGDGVVDTADLGILIANFGA